jgi:hypothetical protein
MAPTAEQEREADHQVEHDHHHGEESVAGKRRVIGAVEHHRRDAGDLDEGDRQGKDQCAVRFAQASGQVVGMAHD